MFKILINMFFFLFAISNCVGNFDGVTTRYWDCCKPSCAWGGKAIVTRPVETCDRNGAPQKGIDSINGVSGCNGGNVFACDSHSPFVVSKNMSYGFAAAALSGQSEKDWCCACYELTFVSGPVIGKKMIIQITNTGYDLGSNHFDLAIPGGGQGIFTGCNVQYNGYQGGQLYGGIKTRAECNRLPQRQRKGCHWRFDWFRNADNPKVKAKNVVCPKELLNISKCQRLR